MAAAMMAVGANAQNDSITGSSTITKAKDNKSQITVYNGSSSLVTLDSVSYVSQGDIKMYLCRSDKDYSNAETKVNGSNSKTKFLKLSNGAWNRVDLPSGVVIEKIAFVGYGNDKEKKAGSWIASLGTYDEANSKYIALYTYDETSNDTLPTKADSQTVDTITIDGLSLSGTFYFKNGGKQPCVNIYFYKAETVTASIAAGGYRGFSSAKAVEVPDDVTIYVVNKGGVDLENYTFEITPIESKIIPANTGVILKGEANTDYTLTVTDEEATASDYANNILVATSVEDNCTIDQTSYDYYAIAKAQYKFLKYTGTQNFNANLSYIRLEAGATSGAKEFDIIEKTTGISSVKTAENGNATLYNLAGQKVSSNYSGIVVKNGKKFMVK